MFTLADRQLRLLYPLAEDDCVVACCFAILATTALICSGGLMRSTMLNCGFECAPDIIQVMFSGLKKALGTMRCNFTVMAVVFSMVIHPSLRADRKIRRQSSDSELGQIVVALSF